MIFRWTITGTAAAPSPGSMMRNLTETGDTPGTIEGVGEALEWLAQRGPWDLIDGQCSIMVEITPAASLPDPEPTWGGYAHGGYTVATWSDPRCQVYMMGDATKDLRCVLVDGHAEPHRFGQS